MLSNSSFCSNLLIFNCKIYSFYPLKFFTYSIFLVNITFVKYKLQYKIVFAFDLREAVLEAQKSASLGDIVLFSPGAASFGMFQNEFERGERFREEVKRL